MGALPALVPPAPAAAVMLNEVKHPSHLPADSRERPESLAFGPDGGMSGTRQEASDALVEAQRETGRVKRGGAPAAAGRLRPLAGAIGRRWWLGAAAVVCLGLLLRLAPIAGDPLHPDESLYASWALAIRGDDPWLRRELLDKPPLFPYLLALWMGAVGAGPTAVRSVGLAAAAAGLPALAWAVRSRYGRGPALAALTLAALSPVAVALDATALTDPPAVALGVAALAVAVAGRSTSAGLLLGLAIATKPQMVAYAPLVLAPLWAGGSPARRPLRAVLAILGVVATVAAWELARAAPVGFVAAAVGNYGLGGGAPFGPGPAREWAGLLRWLWGEPRALLLWAALVVAGAVAAVRARPRLGAGDRLAAASGLSALLYVGGSLALGVPAWDRYALPLLPPVSVVLAWALWRLGGGGRIEVAGLATAALLLALMLPAAREAAAGVLPLGDTSRWQGIEEMTAYVRGRVPGRATIVYREFGWHLRYYMHGFPQDFRWFRDLEELPLRVEGAEPCYVLLSPGEAEEALAMLNRAGHRATPVHAAHRHDGTPSMLLYRIAERP